MVYQAFAVLLFLVFIGGAVAWLLAPRVFPNQSLHRQLVVRAATWVMLLTVAALLLLLFRWQIVPFLSKRLWLILWFLAVIGSLAYAERYRRRVYPVHLAAWESNERRKRYTPRPAQTGNRSRRHTRRTRRNR